MNDHDNLKNNESSYNPHLPTYFHLIDQISKKIMKDPVVLSSGIVTDRSSVMDNNGILKFKNCPFKGEKL